MAVLSLNGCSSSAPDKAKIIVIEKSLNLDKTKQDSPPDNAKSEKNIAPSAKKKEILKDYAPIPVMGKIIQTFSKQNPQIVFETEQAQPVRAILDGIVIYDENPKNHDKTIVIKHPLGFYSFYTPNQNLKIKNGMRVKKGQIIASTQASNFYFKIKKFSTPINPIKYLK